MSSYILIKVFAWYLSSSRIGSNKLHHTFLFSNFHQNISKLVLTYGKSTDESMCLIIILPIKKSENLVCKMVKFWSFGVLLIYRIINLSFLNILEQIFFLKYASNVGSDRETTPKFVASIRLHEFYKICWKFEFWAWFN